MSGRIRGLSHAVLSSRAAESVYHSGKSGRRTGELGCWRGDGELDHHGRPGSLPIGQLAGNGTATVLNTASALI
ncbi:hypothetical protein [Nocardia sp. NPDC004860]|uniref:hypothetical protein n=1 Tax=Nocardia sp. NPDC004860 TaxID=3154557 RepID=UPI0033AC98B9